MRLALDSTDRVVHMLFLSGLKKVSAVAFPSGSAWCHADPDSDALRT